MKKELHVVQTFLFASYNIFSPVMISESQHVVREVLARCSDSRTAPPWHHYQTRAPFLPPLDNNLTM